MFTFLIKIINNIVSFNTYIDLFMSKKSVISRRREKNLHANNNYLTFRSGVVALVDALVEVTSERTADPLVCARDKAA